MLRSTLLKLLLIVIGGPAVVASLSSLQGSNSNSEVAADGHKITTEGVGSLVRQIISNYMDGCYVILIRDGKCSIIFDSILRSLRSAYVAEVVVEVDMTSSNDLDEDLLLNKLKEGDDKFTCRVILIDITGTSDPSSSLRILEKMQLFLIPNAFIAFLGDESLLEDTLMAHPLRNTVDALFLAVLPEKNASAEPAVGDLVKDIFKYRLRQVVPSTPKIIDTELTSVIIYSRCLYCNGGNVGIEKVAEWNSRIGFSKGSGILSDRLHNFRGHQFSVVTLDWFPIIDFTRDSDEISTTVTPQDSSDVRMLTAIAGALNFTYEMRVPWDNQWGSSTNTVNWTGIVGTLQHHKADFSMALSWTWGRYQILDYSRIYASEPIVMIMSKPRPLSPYLALIRPLEWTLWVAVFLSSVSAGFILWALQWGWRITSGAKGLSLDRSVLFTWSILFEEPPKVVPRNVSSQMFVGWWWLYCTLIAVVYRSSLIAHLSIPALSKAIDTFEQLLEADGWTMGYEPHYGSGWEWFKSNQNPTIKSIYERMEVLEFDKQMVRVLDGQHALISWKFKLKSLIAAQYTDNFGYTPIYIAKTEYFNYGGYGWGFRKNSPFLRPIDLVKQRLIETGFVTQWMNDLIGTAAKKTRNEEKRKGAKNQTDKADVQTLHEEPQGLLVLSLHHLQSIFYVLFLGFLAAFLAFTGESLIFCCTKKSPTKHTSAVY